RGCGDASAALGRCRLSLRHPRDPSLRKEKRFAGITACGLKVKRQSSMRGYPRAPANNPCTKFLKALPPSLLSKSCHGALSIWRAALPVAGTRNISVSVTYWYIAGYAYCPEPDFHPLVSSPAIFSDSVR